ncbi:MAG: LysR family transcriptional regulator [Nannocystales bacterium]
MDWRTVRFDWNRARAFLVTAEEGSLSAAAKALGMSQPTLGRQVDALEGELDVTLFERVGRRLVLTESGSDLLEHVRAMGEAASRVSLAATGQSQAIEGIVSVSASQSFSAYLLPPILARLREVAPGISVDVVATDDQIDLLRREADIAVRNVRPEHPDLVAKKVGEADGHLYAASSYLDRVGRPMTPERLKTCDLITWDRGPEVLERLATLGLELSCENIRYACGSHLVQWEMVKQGLGVGVQASLVGDAEPGIERALPGVESVGFPIWLVSHRELHTSKRVRTVFDLLAEMLSDPERG